MRFKLILLLILFAIYPLQANSTINTNTEKMKLPIKYITEINGIKEYTLSNGLKVLLKSNHSIPLLTFSIWYKVGSRNETEGERGLAHFLEHMMFKGTKKLKKGEISGIIQGLGGV